jgi:hypothetical protein
MRKILSLVIVVILTISGLGAVVSSENENELHKQKVVIFSQPITHEQGEFITIDLSEASANSIEVGKPALPVVTKVFTFPFGTRIKNVDVTFFGTIEQIISKPILPAPEPQIVSTIYTSKPAEELNALKTYSDLDVYPESRYSYRTGAGLNNGEHVIYLTIYLHPVQYVPASNMIHYSANADLDITYILPENPITFGDEYDLLIITPSQFESDLQRLVDHKNGRDIQTKLVTLDEIPDRGVDEQESIKYYIKDAIETFGITYLLLVGAGVEGEELFPVRQAWIGSGQYEDYFPSDLYYADIYDSEMQFSDWDADDDGKYAEYYNSNNSDMDAVDVYPDVYLGKLPCNNANELKAVIDKIIYYDEHNKMTNKIVQVGGDTFPGDHEGINEGEYANEAVIDMLDGYSTTQLWASNGKLTKKNIADGFKDNVDFVDFSGHGSWASWATHDTDDEEVWLPAKTVISPYTGFLYVDFDISQINNQYKFPVVIYNACSCNKYSEDPNCIAWSTVKRPNGGGIAAFGASGIGYGGHGTGEIERVWGWMEVRIFDELYNTKILGEVWSNAVTDYANSFELDDGDYKTLLEMSMFGDPTLAIEDGEEPKIKSISNPSLNIFLEQILSRFQPLERLLQLPVWVKLLSRLSR